MTDITGNDELNDMGYASSAPDFSNLAPATQIKPQDEADLPALIRLSHLLASRLDYYRTNDSISLDEINDGTLREQMKDNKRMVFHIQELQNLIDTTVKSVKERLNERN